MFIIIGSVIVIASVLGGFVMHEGPLLVLLQWNEFLIIGGSAIGSLLVSAPLATLKSITAKVIVALKGDPYTREQYLELLKTQFELFSIAQRDGLINIEAHIERPEESTVFKKNEFLLHNHHAMNFLCDTMKLLLGGGVAPYDLEGMLDADIDTHHFESKTPPMLIQKIGDSLPGLGIVAAVLGIITTMQSIGGPPEVVGQQVAAALVGTFLGILLSYGFVQPLATNIEILDEAEAQFLQCMKAAVVAYAKGNAPMVVVEFARRVVPHSIRPSFVELEKAAREVRSGGATT